MFRSPHIITVFSAILVFAVGANAAESHAVGGVVFLNNVPVLELKAASVTGNPAVQAALIAKHLRAADDDAEVKVITDGSNSQIYVGSIELKVSGDEAIQHGKKSATLAESWASTIREALSLPPLKFSSDALRLPLNASNKITLAGSLAYAAKVTSTNESVLRVSGGPGGLLLSCVGIGDAQVKALSGNSVRTLDVSVRPNAGNLPQLFVAEVTGSPVSWATVAGVIEGCLRSRLVCLPGAYCSFEPVQAESLPKGLSRTYSVRVRLRAKDAFDSVGDVTVTVKNLEVAPLDDTSLWYSNAPESVQQTGFLFSSFLKKDAPIRFLYHHVDASSQPMIIRVEVINDSDKVARVLVSQGDSKPDKNPVRAGMTAANEYLKNWVAQSGEVISVPPHSTFPISVRRLSPKETMSGLCTLRLLSGANEVQVRTDALPAFEMSPAWVNAALSSTPWREVGTQAINDYDRASYEPSLHVYPNPYKTERLDYSVGGRSGFLLIGQKPIPGEDHNSNLDGNFGVIYKIKGLIKNETEVTTDVELVFEASAGYMGGLFLVDGTMIQTPLLSPKGEQRLARYHLARGATRTFDIVTLPVSGGSYPATLYLRPVEPVGSALAGKKGKR